MRFGASLRYQMARMAQTRHRDDNTSTTPRATSQTRTRTFLEVKPPDRRHGHRQAGGTQAVKTTTRLEKSGEQDAARD